MKSFNEVKKGDIVKSIEDGSIYEIVVYRGEKYLSGFHDMWNVNQFDPKDWVKLSEETIYCVEKFADNKWEPVGTFDTYDKAKTQIEFEKRHDNLFNKHDQYRIIVKE